MSNFDEVIIGGSPPANKQQALKKLSTDFNYLWNLKVQANNLVPNTNKYDDDRKVFLKSQITVLEESLSFLPTRDIKRSEKEVDQTINTIVRYLRDLKKVKQGKAELFEKFLKNPLQLPGSFLHRMNYQPHQIEARKEFLKRLKAELTTGKNSRSPTHEQMEWLKNKKQNPKLSGNRIAKMFEEKFGKQPARSTVLEHLKSL